MSRLGHIQTDRGDVRKLQDGARKLFDVLFANPAAEARMLEGVELAAGANQVAHGLGRPIVRWIPVRVRAQATLWDAQDTQTAALKAKFLKLHSSAAVTVDLLVF